MANCRPNQIGQEAACFDFVNRDDRKLEAYAYWYLLKAERRLQRVLRVTASLNIYRNAIAGTRCARSGLQRLLKWLVKVATIKLTPRC